MIYRQEENKFDQNFIIYHKIDDSFSNCDIDKWSKTVKNSYQYVAVSSNLHHPRNNNELNDTFESIEEIKTINLDSQQS